VNSKQVNGGALQKDAFTARLLLYMYFGYPLPGFDLSEGWGGLGDGLNPHWLKMTPTLVTENFCLGGRLRPPLSPDPTRRDPMSNDKPQLRFSTIGIHIVKIMVDGIIILQFLLQKTV